MDISDYYDTTYQYPVVKLNCSRILKDVFDAGGECQQVIRDPTLSHLWEGVVHKTSIQASNKGPCWNRPPNNSH